MSESLPPPPPEGHRRVAAIVEYDGTNFCGFQRQINGRTVAGVLETAATTLGSANPLLKCAGRTDTGVHADGQVVALWMPERFEERRMKIAFNAVLPEDIRVRDARVCAMDFDPRRAAVQRTYVYRLCSGEPVPPLMRFAVAEHVRPLRTELLAEAFALFQGEWEFREWRASQCQGKRTRLRIDSALVEPPARDERWVTFTISSRSFLHNMVRFLVGGAIAVAQQKLSVAELRAALADGKRPSCVVPADACGLTLKRVKYPAESDPFLP